MRDYDGSHKGYGHHRAKLHVLELWINSATSHLFFVRLSDSEKRIIDGLAETKAISRSEAVRLAIHVARPLLISSTGININRVLVSLELLAAVLT